jgi:hypothetical protein
MSKSLAFASAYLRWYTLALFVPYEITSAMVNLGLWKPGYCADLDRSEQSLGALEDSFRQEIASDDDGRDDNQRFIRPIRNHIGDGQPWPVEAGFYDRNQTGYHHDHRRW